jgi:hypothetical protein
MSLEIQQRATCERHGAAFDPPSAFAKIGIALATLNMQPLNGLRHVPEPGTSGWFIWGGGELSTDPNFFQPLHVHHVQERCPAALPFLALPSGYRFLVATGHVDVWQDRTLTDW